MKTKSDIVGQKSRKVHAKMTPKLPLGWPWEVTLTSNHWSLHTQKCSWGPKTQKQWVGGGGRKSLFHYNFCFQKCSWGPETHTNLFLFFGGILGYLGRKNDTLFPLTMTRDRPKFWNFGVFGAPHASTRGSREIGKRYTSSFNHDPWPAKILERSALAVKSYRPETLAAAEKKTRKKNNSDKTIRHSRWGMPNQRLSWDSGHIVFG